MHRNQSCSIHDGIGGVETGKAKPRLAPRQAPRAGTTGDTPSAWAMAMTKGMSMAADAVFDANSLISTPAQDGHGRELQTPLVPNKLTKPAPAASDRPVLIIKSPKASPPPNKRIIPQLILEACFQLRVRRLFRDRSAEQTSNPAASSATNSLGTCALIKQSNCAPIPTWLPSKPGTIQSTTAMAKAMHALICPRVHYSAVPRT